MPKSYIPRASCLIWVHTWWKRDSVRGPTLKSLETSDVGTFEIRRQPETTHAIDFFADTLADICKTHEWMLRLEDDTLVNRHLWHNVSTWDVPHKEKDFGVGFLSWPKPVLRDAAHIGKGKVTGAPYRNYPEMHFGGGMLYRCSTVSKHLQDLRSRMRAYTGKNANLCLPFSCMPTRMLWEAGLRAYFHMPCIVQIDTSIPRSKDGKVIPEAVFGGQSFDPKWRR